MRPKTRFELATTLAYQCLLARNVRTLPVSPESMLRNCANTRLLTVEQAAEALGQPLEWIEKDVSVAEAWTYNLRDENGQPHYIVIVNRDVHPARLNFNLAHELGHILLEHRGGNQNEEWEADCFAMHLLCPAPVVRQMMNRRGRVWAEQVAAQCFVSVSAVMTAARLPGRPVDQALEAQVAELLQGTAEPYETDEERTRLWHPVNMRRYTAHIPGTMKVPLEPLEPEEYDPPEDAPEDEPAPGDAEPEDIAST